MVDFFILAMSTSPPQIFRKDINGLRAWAVMVVVLFHFGVPGFAGGFIGVDIFFVISGFLMTNILIKKLENPHQKFSVWDFYLARAKRIVPALLVLCITLLALGWLMLPPQDYRSLGMHTLTSVLFASNIQYWREAGYFDVASHDKWLLHTWSLSVEWQFYVLLPLLPLLHGAFGVCGLGGPMWFGACRWCCWHRSGCLSGSQHKSLKRLSFYCAPAPRKC